MVELPETYLHNMCELLGDELKDYLACFERDSIRSLRLNTRKIQVHDFLKMNPFTLTSVPWSDDGFYYAETDDPTRHPYYYAELYYIQEASAMLPAQTLPIEEGDKVLDLCAAPGGKTLKIAAGQGFAQGVFMPFGITTDDDADGVRNGGLGSTG